MSNKRKEVNADKPVLDSSYPDGDGYWNVRTIDISQERVDETAKDRHDLVYRLRKRAEIRRQIPDRKSVQEGQPDRIADLLEEAADALEKREWVEQPPEPEAVAWMWKDGTLTSDPDFADGTWTPLFAAPPKREWVAQPDLARVGEVGVWGEEKNT
jgi:hypothetical protein